MPIVREGRNLVSSDAIARQNKASAQIQARLNLTDPASTDPSSLKIFIGSTAKTGNVWLRSLLASVYGLRTVETVDHIDEETLQSLGRGWIAHQHFSPNERILKLLRRHEVTVLTVLRHPGDVLVSLKAFMGGFDDAHERDPYAASMLRDGESFGPAALEYVREHFAAQINLSLFWWRMGAIPVRYEQLRHDPLNSLRALTDRLSPVPDTRLKTALALNNIKRMRSQHSDSASHFRNGRTGDWRELLPPEIVEVFRHTRPYPALFAALGYSVDGDAGKLTRGHRTAFEDPFRGEMRFDNGVPISDFLIALYFDLEPKSRERWPDPVSTSSADSYFSWLNAPCDEDPESATDRLPLTHLALAVHKSRPDLQSAFPDPLGQDRARFFDWFHIYAPGEYGLASALLEPARTRSTHASTAKVDNKART